MCFSECFLFHPNWQPQLLFSSRFIMLKVESVHLFFHYLGFGLAFVCMSVVCLSVILQMNTELELFPKCSYSMWRPS